MARTAVILVLSSALAKLFMLCLFLTYYRGATSKDLHKLVFNSIQ